MRIHVKLFAILREKAETSEMTLELAPGASARDAGEKLAQICPALAGHLNRVAYAVNQSYVAANAVLNDGDELALIPPVSGG